MVIKVGTGVVARADRHVALGRLGGLVEQIHELMTGDSEHGLPPREVVLVSSGAIGLGAERLGLAKRPVTALDKRACAAAGQGALIAMYDELFRRMGHRVAQVLPTESDFHHRDHHVGLTATLERLIGYGAIPVINENDVMSDQFAEDGRIFEDNDRLAALVATGIGANALVLLSDVTGVLTAPPGTPGAERICVYHGESVQIGAISPGGRGGIAAKMAAAQVAARGGVNTVIASGFDGDVLRKIFRGDDVGTVFPAGEGMSRRRSWMAFATAPQGTVTVNEGARQAMVGRKASLLPAGVLSISGEFSAGAVVRIVCGSEFARGTVGVNADDARAMVGQSGRNKALVHRDNMVILDGATS